MRSRYKIADKQLDRDNLVVAWYSQTFRNILKTGNDRVWPDFLDQLVAEKNFMMKIAITAGLNPVEQYTKSKYAAELPLLNPGAFRRTRALGDHPHEAYLALDGGTRRCIFTDQSGKTSDMINLMENSYIASNFTSYQRPDNG
jgi:hypothetical protein